MPRRRFILVVLDGLGVGELPDAADFGDAGANTLGNLSRSVGGLRLPNFEKLGLGCILPIEGVPPAPAPAASWGRMAELSKGKDSTLGHWELAGLVTERPLPTYPEGFPGELNTEFVRRCGLPGVLGNRPASGTEIIAELGAEHLATGKPIVYTSADSVYQIAAHEDVIPLDRLCEICRTAREILRGEHAVARVIARPFTGSEGSFTRTPHRRDFSLKPFGRTALEILGDGGVEVCAVGKIGDLFAGVGIERSVSAKGNEEGLSRLLELLREGALEAGATDVKSTTAGGAREQLILLNLVDFDMLWGHRLDPRGFKEGLEALDRRLPELLELLSYNDLLVFTADHGNDPTSDSTDHSREYAPLLAYRRGLPGLSLGTRESFADVAASMLEWFSRPAEGSGRSFLGEMGTCGSEYHASL